MVTNSMVHLVVLLGEPGVGKTTLVRQTIERLHHTWTSWSFGQLRGRLYETDSQALIVFGSEDTSRGVFLGTDAWPMRARNDVPACWRNYVLPRRPATVLLEGDRLVYPDVFESALEQHFHLSMLHLAASPAVLATRPLRESSHPIWANGMRKHLQRMSQRYAERCPYYYRRSETISELEDNVAFLSALLERGPDVRR